MLAKYLATTIRVLVIFSLSCTAVFAATNPFSEIEANIGFTSDSDPFQCGHIDGSSGATDNCNRKHLVELSVKNRKTLGYNGARLKIFQEIDVKTDENGRKFVESCYSDDILEITKPGIPNGKFNTEHTWPQSLLKKHGGFNDSRADLYHLFPSEIRINGKRSSLPFTDCEGEPTSTEIKVAELCNNAFEPPEQQKGIIARAMFYMSLSYNIPIDEAQEKVLKIWNKQFLPTEQEIERANRIINAQGNINPFITHPEYADLISDF